MPDVMRVGKQNDRLEVRRTPRFKAPSGCRAWWGLHQLLGEHSVCSSGSGCGPASNPGGPMENWRAWRSHAGRRRSTGISFQCILGHQGNEPVWWRGKQLLNPKLACARAADKVGNHVWYKLW